MAEVSKRDPDFLNIQEDKLKDALGLGEVEFDLISANIPSVNSASPGDVVSFVYNGAQFIAIAVSNARTGSSSAIFRNTRTKNKLFSCFLVDHLSSESLKIFIQALNKYRDYTKIASYRYITTLFGMLIGKDRYRTFISTGRMANLTRIQIREIQ